MLDRMLEYAITTLGKIDIKGPDSAEFLNRVYTKVAKTANR